MPCSTAPTGQPNEATRIIPRKFAARCPISCGECWNRDGSSCTFSGRLGLLYLRMPKCAATIDMARRDRPFTFESLRATGRRFRKLGIGNNCFAPLACLAGLSALGWSASVHTQISLSDPVSFWHCHNSGCNGVSGVSRIRLVAMASQARPAAFNDRGTACPLGTATRKRRESH